MQNALRKNWLLCLGFIILGLLLFRNPFSGDSISTIDPYPDALIYTSSAKSLMLGQGFKLIYENNSLTPGVPILYPLILAPFLKLIGDPRSYYFYK